MSITVKREEFNAALRAVERAAARRENVPVLRGVLLDARQPGELAVAATDLELAIRATLPMSGDAGWARVVDARLLVGLASRLGGETVTLDPTETQLRVVSGGATFTLASMGAEDFPKLTQFEARATVRTTAGILAGVLGRVAFAAAQFSQRPVLSGVFVEVGQLTVTLAATDGARLATDHLDLKAPTGATDSQPVSVIVPRRSVEEAIRILGAANPATEIVMDVGERLVALRAGAYTLTTQLIEGMFPPFRQVLLSDPAHRVGFERRALLDALYRLSLLSVNKPAIVTFRPGPTPGTVEIRAAEADVGEGTEIVRAVGAPWPASISTTYQARFIIEFLNAVKSSEVEYGVSDPTKQCAWSVAGSNYCYVVMPVLGDAITPRAAAA